MSDLVLFKASLANLLAEPLRRTWASRHALGLTTTVEPAGTHFDYQEYKAQIIFTISLNLVYLPRLVLSATWPDTHIQLGCNIKQTIALFFGQIFVVTIHSPSLSSCK